MHTHVYTYSYIHIYIHIQRRRVKKIQVILLPRVASSRRGPGMRSAARRGAALGGCRGGDSWFRIMGPAAVSPTGDGA